MHLPERRGRERLGLERGEELLRRRAELADDLLADRRRIHRRHGRLHGREYLERRGRQQIAPHAQHLDELHERALQLGRALDDADRVPHVRVEQVAFVCARRRLERALERLPEIAAADRGGERPDLERATGAAGREMLLFRRLARHDPPTLAPPAGACETIGRRQGAEAARSGEKRRTSWQRKLSSRWCARSSPNTPRTPRARSRASHRRMRARSCAGLPARFGGRGPGAPRGRAGGRRSSARSVPRARAICSTTCRRGTPRRSCTTSRRRCALRRSPGCRRQRARQIQSLLQLPVRHRRRDDGAARHVDARST